MNPNRRGLWLASAVFALLTLLWCGPILTDPAHVVADVGDPLHMAWAMSWVGHQVVRDPGALFDANAFYPYPGSLAFGDHLLPEGLLGLPVALISGNAALSLNLVTAFGLFSSALAAGFVVSRLLQSQPAGLVAAVCLAFNGFMQGELLRVNVLQLQGWCLALYFLWTFTDDTGWRSSWAFALALGLQGLTGTYYAIYSALLAPFLVLAAYGARGRRPRLHELARLAIPALVTGLAGLAFLSPYRRVAAQSLAQKPIPDGADLASFLLPGPHFWLLGGWLPTPPRGESNHFLGYAAMALAVTGLAVVLSERAKPGARAISLALAGVIFITVGAVISIGPYPRLMGHAIGTSPYLLVLRSVSILRGMATVERAGVLVHIGLALLAAVGAERLSRGKRGPLLAAGLAALVAAEQWTPPGPGFRVPAGAELPDAYRFLATGTGPVVEVPVFPDRLLRFRALYPYFSTYHWRPVPFGRASFYPPAHDYLATLMQGFPDPVSIAALRALSIRDVLVHPRMWSTRRGARLRALEGPDFDLVKTFPEAVSPAAADLDMGDERIHRVRQGAALPSPCVPADAFNPNALTVLSKPDGGTHPLQDGDPSTAWSTVRPQREGDAIEALWKDVRPVAAVRLAFGFRPSDFPIAARVETLDSLGLWSPREETFVVESAIETLTRLVSDPRQAARTLRFDPVEARGLRVVLGSDEARPPWNPWSVAEMTLFAACEVVGVPRS